MFDNTCKYLAENFPSDFASWLLGKSIILTKLEPSELSVETIRADSVIFLESSEIIIHIEFQTITDDNMAFRMLDFWVSIREGSYSTITKERNHERISYLSRNPTRR